MQRYKRCKKMQRYKDVKRCRYTKIQRCKDVKRYKDAKMQFYMIVLILCKI